MSTSFGLDLLVPNVCTDATPQIFRDTRHDELCKDIKGNVIKCGSNNKMISPKTLINHSLLKWGNHALSDSMDHNHGDTFLLLSGARKYIAAYCYSYHTNRRYSPIDDDFWVANKYPSNITSRKV